MRPRLPTALLLLLCGCFQYLPATPTTVSAGAELRVGLTPAGSAGLAPIVGSSVTGVEGQLAGTPGDTLTVRVSRLLTAAGVAIDWAGAPVDIPRQAIASVERQVVARRRTAIVVGVAAALGVLAWGALRPGRGGGGGDGPGPGPIL